ncbi:hypothetical protein NMG60_11026959 [Bertholletia excelsa]
MEANYMLLLILFWAFIVAGCAYTDSEGKTTSATSLDPKTASSLKNNSNPNEKTGGLKSVLGSEKVNRVNKDKDEVGGSKEGVHDNNKFNETDSSKQNKEELESDHVEKKEDGPAGKNVKKETSSEGAEPKEEKKEISVRKESFGGEECDASNSCKDDDNALVACLRVPGNESPDLSLLIQNKGKGPLSVTISAPDFVQLGKTKIELQEKKNAKVKVSIMEGGNDSLIILKSRKGNCSLDFRELISLNSGKTRYSAKSAYINLVKRTPLLAFVIFAAVLVAASGWICVSYQKRCSRSSGSKYQRLDTELPVSAEGKVDSDSNDGWDNSWGDKWDDEEAPMTPSMPVTPSLSSKGLASRRLNKEGWKD